LSVERVALLEGGGRALLSETSDVVVVAETTVESGMEWLLLRVVLAPAGALLVGVSSTVGVGPAAGPAATGGSAAVTVAGGVPG